VCAGVVWCGAYCILHVISHTNTRAATNGGTAADGIANFTKKDHGRELTRGAVDSVALAHSVCVYLSHVPRYLREQFQGEYGQVPWRP
jgi:hypothetical protein